MKKDFTLIVYAENNFSVLNRMINICNRRRVRIRKLLAHELDNPHRGEACFILYTTRDVAEKVQLQVDKLIEVEETRLQEGAELFYDEAQTATL
jgi:acetolactate synthase-1/3 small subunit